MCVCVYGDSNVWDSEPVPLQALVMCTHWYIQALTQFVVDACMCVFMGIQMYGIVNLCHSKH